jgi:nucleoside-diphosphate-sugar epimerase
MKRILITGGAGFIGSNIAQELIKRGDDVKIIDNLTTGKVTNIKNILDKIKFIQGDIRDLNLLKKLMKEVDYVFHQAAIPSVPRSVKDPIASNRTNVEGTLNVLVAAKDNNVKKVIYASSSSVYGDTLTLPKVETMKPNPLSSYAVTKLTGEYYCKVFYKIYGLRTISLRYFNVFGRNQDPASEYAAVIPKFITGVLSNKPLIIYGDGKQTRDFTFIKDVVQANIKAAESSKGDGEVLNIARGERITINELSEMIINMVGKKIKPLYDKPRPGDIKHSLADVSRAKELIGYIPEYSLKEGLKNTIDFYLT